MIRTNKFCSTLCNWVKGKIQIKFGLLLIAICLITSPLHGQFIQTTISHGKNYPSKKKNPRGGRIQSLEPMKLPFWDDFSFTQEKDLANDTLWSIFYDVWRNDGMAINPPSIFTATFDGIDSTGKPYNIVDVLAKGFADRLVSRPIQLDILDASQNDSVYLSFFYQVTGHGEAPDTDDNFILSFKDQNGNWEKVFEVGNNSTLDVTKFYYQNLKVDKKYFHGNFQFRFQNFARLSGPYDTWHLDYVYLNKRRKASDDYFPDRASVKPMTSIFKKYTAIPIKHYSYKDTARSITVSPRVTFYNLFKDDQPSDYTTFARIFMRVDSIPIIKKFRLDNAFELSENLIKKAYREVTLNKTIPIDSLNLTADSINIDFRLGFDSGDPNYVAGVTPFFVPTNFSLNDTIHSEFILHKHYAYDDGSAEYGAGMNAPGSQLAYAFDMFTQNPDTIVSVQIHFPEFGDNTNQTLTLKLWNAVDTLPGTEIYRQTITVTRTADNKFTTYDLVEGIGVKGRFFVGWEHPSSVIIPVGLDKNTESRSQIYFNITGSWEQNQNVHGSLMIRPVFGKGKAAPITGVETKQIHLYPNPNSGEFYLPASAENILITNMLGSSVSFSIEETVENKRVSLNDRTPGLIIVRWAQDNKLSTARVLVRN